MEDPKENFTTITHREFDWPYPMPIITKPSQPPMNTGTRLYTPRTDPDDCKCDAHGYQSNKNRYKRLADKERRLCKELHDVDREMAIVASSMIDSTCEKVDDTMKSIYQTDYQKRGLPIDDYRKLMVAVDSPVSSPIKPEVTELRDGYRDPTMFRHSAIEGPDVQPSRAINPPTGTFSLWDEPFTGRSEYMDTISKMGLRNMKNRQQYREPLPSAKKRFDDCSV